VTLHRSPNAAPPAKTLARDRARSLQQRMPTALRRSGRWKKKKWWALLDSNQ
jgi:hypothetical protein